MVLHDYQCEADGCETEPRFDQLSTEPPSCPAHGQMSIWYHSKRYRPFEAFEYEEEGTGRQVKVESMRQLREIEARSMAAYEQGEGRPVIFRQYSQDKSNRDQNVFHRLKQQVDRRDLVTRNSRGVPFITSTQGPDIPYSEEE